MPVAAAVIEFARYIVMLVFAFSLAVSFAGARSTYKNFIAFCCFCIALFALEVATLIAFGLDVAFMLYPFTTHIPIALFIALYLKRPWLDAFTGMFVSVLCCQPSRWIGSVASSLTGSVSANHIGYILSSILVYVLVQRCVVKSVRLIMQRSLRTRLFFAAIPAFYYVFEFVTTVYTDFMYRRSRVAVQFLPFVTTMFYFCIVLYYYEETQRQAKMQRERDMLDTQLRQAQTELSSLRQMQQNAATYRHDMRHHLALMQSLAAEEAHRRTARLPAHGAVGHRRDHAGAILRKRNGESDNIVVFGKGASGGDPADGRGPHARKRAVQRHRAVLAALKRARECNHRLRRGRRYRAA